MYLSGGRRHGGREGDKHGGRKCDGTGKALRKYKYDPEESFTR